MLLLIADQLCNGPVLGKTDKESDIYQLTESSVLPYWNILLLLSENFDSITVLDGHEIFKVSSKEKH